MTLAEPHLPHQALRLINSIPDLSEDPAWLRAGGVDPNGDVIAVDAALARLNAILRGDMDETRRTGLLRAIRSKTVLRGDARGRPAHMPLDGLTADLFAWRGVDPIAAVWCALTSGEKLEIQHLGTDDDLASVACHGEVGDMTGGTWIELADDVIWHQTGNMTVPASPAAVEAAMAGRPLGDVVAHPLLRCRNTLITQTDGPPFPGGTSIIWTDHVRTPADDETMLDASRRLAAARAASRNEAGRTP